MNLYHGQSFPLVCVSFRGAPIEIREQVLRGVAAHHDVCSRMREAVGPHWVVTTCHRIEVYLHAWPASSVDSLVSKLLDAIGLNVGLAGHAKVCLGWEAARHGIRVASGLDSVAVGEPQILDQMAEAARKSRQEGCLDEFLSQVARRICKAGARVRERSGLASHSASLGEGAAWHLLATIGAPWERRGVVVGTGSVAQEVVRVLSGKVGWLGVAGRRFSRAQRVANIHRVTPLTLSDALEAIYGLDFAIFALHLENPIALEAGKLPDGFMLMDLGMPRNVAVDLAHRSRFVYCDVDELPLAASYGMLRAAVQKALECTENELCLLRQWYQKYSVGPMVALLHRWASELADKEVKRSESWIQVCGEPCRAHVERLARSLVRKILAKPLLFMQAHPDDGPAKVMEIFGLERPDGQEEPERTGHSVHRRWEGEDHGSPRHGTQGAGARHEG